MTFLPRRRLLIPSILLFFLPFVAYFLSLQNNLIKHVTEKRAGYHSFRTSNGSPKGQSVSVRQRYLREAFLYSKDINPPYKSQVTPNSRDGIPNILTTTLTDPSFHMFVYPIDVDRFISQNIINSGIYEEGTTKLVTKHLPMLHANNHNNDNNQTVHSSCKINLVLDLGSNLGYYSLLAASRGYDVISFEASPDTAWLQRSSAALNGFLTPMAVASTNQNLFHDQQSTFLENGSLLLINKGVSDVKSIGQMSRHPSSPGMTSFAASSEFHLKKGKKGSALDVSIELVRADDVLSKLGLKVSTDGVDRPREVCYKLLKIDVEGYELKALRGLFGETNNTNNNFSSIPYPFEFIILEYFPSMLKAAGTNPIEMLQFIERWGYQFYVIDKAGELSKIEKLQEDERVNGVDHGSSYHINLFAQKIN